MKTFTLSLTKTATFAALVSIAAATGSTAVAAQAPEAAGAYVVQYRDNADMAKESASAKSRGAVVTRTFTHAVNALAVRMTPTQANALRANPNVVGVEVDSEYRASATQTSSVWGLDRVDQRSLPLSGSYDYQLDGTGVNVYIVDTGVRADHVELTGRVVSGYSAISDSNGTSDCNGHGTHVAGTVAGTTYGVAKKATIIPVRVLDCRGSGTLSGVVAGLDWAVQHHQAGVAAAANMSLGGGASSTIDAAVSKLISDGVTVVVAAGNETADACTKSPARVPAAITVAASDSADAQASFSNFGSCVDLYAPGVNVTSAANTSSTATATYSGTSMASPHVAGAAALFLSESTSANPAEVAAKLTGDATTGALTMRSSTSPDRLLYTANLGSSSGGGDTVVNPAPATVPGAPNAVTASAGKRSASVQWTAGPDGGSPLTSQTVWVYQGAAKVGYVNVSPTVRKVTISGLTPGVTYTFTVSASNAVGAGPESTQSNPVTPKR